MKNETPAHLFKILSLENWEASQNREVVSLPPMDDLFIHLSREDQLEKILKKYWSDAQKFVILKIETEKLVGKLELEKNPGGTSKFFHLYEGYIPLSSVIDFKIVSR